MRIKVLEENDICNPDSVYIFKWNLDLEYHDYDSKCITFLKNNTVILFRDNHIMLRKYYKIKKSDVALDLRIWIENKLITFWTSDSKNYLKTIKQCLEQIKKENLIDNIDSYNIIFQKKDENNTIFIIDCPVSEIDDAIDDEYYFQLNENYYNRGRLHLMSPFLKKNFIKQGEIHYQYIKSCQYWSDKIGNLDIAHYHLLIYEE